MAIVGITKPGLITIAILVAILWGCLVSERLTLQNANREIGRSQVKASHPGPIGKARRRGAVA